MTDTPLNSAFYKTPELPSRGGLSTLDMERLSQDYLLDWDYRMQSSRTTETRRTFHQNLLWFLKHRSYETCATAELRSSFPICSTGIPNPAVAGAKTAYSSRCVPSP